MSGLLILAFLKRNLGPIIALGFALLLFGGAVTFWLSYQHDKAAVVQLTADNNKLRDADAAQDKTINGLLADQKANAAILSDLQAEKDAIQASKTKRIVQIEKQPNDGAAPASIRCAISGVCK